MTRLRSRSRDMRHGGATFIQVRSPCLRSMAGSPNDVDPPLPRIRADLSAFPLDDELVIYDPRTGESFILNVTGRLVYERCDGERTEADIADEIAAIHGIPVQQALIDVNELLMSFREANMFAHS